MVTKLVDCCYNDIFTISYLQSWLRVNGLLIIKSNEIEY
jgi:hypothetical protein